MAVSGLRRNSPSIIFTACFVISEVAFALLLQAHPFWPVKIVFWVEWSSCAAADVRKHHPLRIFRVYWVSWCHFQAWQQSFLYPSGWPRSDSWYLEICNEVNKAGSAALSAGGPCFQLHNEAVVSHESQTSQVWKQQLIFTRVEALWFWPVLADSHWSMSSWIWSDIIAFYIVFSWPKNNQMPAVAELFCIICTFPIQG